MEMVSWNHWIKKIDNSSIDEIDSEIFAIETDDKTPYVEKNLKLGYLYYTKDYLGTATQIFKALAKKIDVEKSNFRFIEENKKGLNILYMGFRIVPDGCGGFDIIESNCCGDGCGPICACLGIAAVMSICGIAVSDITTCDTTDGQGCCDNGLNSCDGCCDDWCGDGQCCCN